MISETRKTSSGSTEYSRVRCVPLRTTFSVRTERLSTSTESRKATVDETTTGITASHWCVSSIANTMPVSGLRITPPTTAARLISARNPGATGGNT